MSAEQVLREPWPDRERQRVAASFGLWIFLASEVLFFGSILFAYVVLRVLHPDAFRTAAHEAAVAFGTVNTVILLTSSFALALADGAVAGKRETLARRAIWAALLLGLAFLVVKGFEYAKDISEHLVPGADFKFGQGPEQLFWAFYWIVTVVHAVHVTIGLGLMTRLLLLARRGPLARERDTVEVTALYWHLVDCVWVLLYPLIYLVGRP